MNILEEYKDLYNENISLINNQTQRIGHYLTILTILGTAQILLWKDAFVFDCVPYFVWYAISLAFSSLAYVICIIFFVRTFTTGEVKYIDPKTALETANEYRQNINIGTQKELNEINESIEQDFEEGYIKATIDNHITAIKMKQNLKCLTVSIVISFLLHIVSFILWATLIYIYK